MAKINVQPKEPSPWLWLIGTLAAIGVVALIVALSRDRDTAALPGAAVLPSAPSPNLAATSGIDAPPPAIAAFLTFAETSIGSPAGPAHEYAADGIRRLTQAMNAIAQQPVAESAIREQLAGFRDKADRIQADPKATGHADQVRDVFTSASDLMSAVQKNRWPDSADLRSQIAEIRAAGTAIDPDRPLLDQTAKLDAFFDRAAGALRAMSAKTS